MWDYRSVSTYLNLLRENQSLLRPWKMINKIQFYAASEAIFQIDPGQRTLSHTPFFLSWASLFVAATCPQLRQERRKLEIRSSSHKSLQSPKGPQNTSKRFPLTTDQPLHSSNSAPTFHIDNMGGKKHPVDRTPQCVYVSGSGPGAIFSQGAIAIIGYVCKLSIGIIKGQIKNWCLLIDTPNWQ